MKKEDFFDVIGELDDDIVKEAKTLAEENKNGEIRRLRYLKWGAMAACLCLIVFGTVRILMPAKGGRAVLNWSEGFQAADYFAYNYENSDASSTNSISDRAIPYAAERDFSDDRMQMEADGVLPEMPDYPLYHCIAHYNEDGSILSVTISWHRRGNIYSDLSITAGYQEVEIIQDCITIELDADGNILPTAVTVTERDGIQIVAKGSRKQSKTLTFQSDTGWYQISGSWNDSYEAIVKLLDWIWEHPIDFGLFDMDRGNEFTATNLDEVPGAFAEYIPDFSSFGYVQGENYIILKNGVPYSFEGHYYTGIDEALVKDGSYLSKDGWSEIHWCIDTEPDYYDRQDSLGNISELTEQLVTDTLSKASNFSFVINNCFIKVYAKEAHETWLLVETLMND